MEAAASLVPASGRGGGRVVAVDVGLEDTDELLDEAGCKCGWSIHVLALSLISFMRLLAKACFKRALQFARHGTGYEWLPDAILPAGKL